MADRDQDRPEVIAFPPLIYLAFLLMGLAMDYVHPIAVLPTTTQYIAGFAIIALGGVIAVSAILRFRRARTSLGTFAPASYLVTGCLFRF